MDVKKRKDFTVKKEDNFLIILFFFFFVSLLRRGKFYNAAVRPFLKLLEKLQGNFCDGEHF